MEIGAYRLIEKIATGGMAEIFLAEPLDPMSLHRQLVIKRILPQFTQNQDLVLMLVDEARIATRLRHENIAQVYELDIEQGEYFIVMEYVHGRDVRRVAERGMGMKDFIPLPLACRLIADAAKGFHFAHTQVDAQGQPLNIIHRDVSPQNIVAGFNGVVKIVDFGIAKAADRIATTRTGQLKGKFGYMSPEQVLGLSLDHRSDIFALGTILYEITVRARLFKGNNDLKTIGLVAKGPIPSPSRVRPSYPPALERIVMRALARDLKHRYQTMEDLSRDLERFLDAFYPNATRKALASYLQRIFRDLIQAEPSQVVRQQIDEDAATTLWDKDAVVEAASGGVAPVPSRPTLPPPRSMNPSQPQGGWAAFYQEMKPSSPLLTASPREPLVGAAPARGPARLEWSAPSLPKTDGGLMSNPYDDDPVLRPDHRQTLQPTASQQLGGGGQGGLPDPNQRTPDYDPNEDFEGDLFRQQKKKRNMILAIVGGGALIAAIVIGLIFGGVLDSKIHETADSETEKTPEAELGPPTWKEMEMMPVEVRTNPPGAAIVVNGDLREGLTPFTVDLIKDRPNTVAVFKQGYLPSHHFLPIGVEISQGVEITLVEEPPEAEPEPEPQPIMDPDDPTQVLIAAEAPTHIKRPPYGKVHIRTPNEEDKGAKVYFDGVQVGVTPMTMEHVAVGHLHHVLLKKDGKAPHVALFKMMNAEQNIELLLSKGVFLDRTAQVNVEAAPPTAEIEMNGQLSSGMTRVDYSKGDLVHLKVRQAEYESWEYTFHTTPVGNYTVMPGLKQFKEAPAKVQWIIPEGEFWYPCLKRPSKSVCWDDEFVREPKRAMSGTYQVKVWEQLPGRASDRRWAKNMPEINLLPLHYYEITIDFSEEEEVKLTVAEPVPWDPVAEDAQNAIDKEKETQELIKKRTKENRQRRKEEAKKNKGK